MNPEAQPTPPEALWAVLALLGLVLAVTAALAGLMWPAAYGTATFALGVIKALTAVAGD